MPLLAQATNQTSGGISPTLIAAGVSAIVALIVCLMTGQGNQLRFLLGLVQKIIEFSMTYPYLEDDEFCSKWPEIDDRDQKLRYENYCCHVFNTLEHAWSYAQGDTCRMKWIIYPDELIVRHRKWWEGECDNHSGYDQGFCDFVDDIIRKHSKDNRQ